MLKVESVTYIEGTRGLLLAELAKANSELVVTNLLTNDEKFLSVIEQIKKILQKTNGYSSIEIASKTPIN